MVRRSVKIAHIVEGFSGGLCTYMCHVLPELVRRGFHITLVTSLERSDPDGAGRIQGLQDRGVSVEIVPMSRRISVTRDARAFAAIVRLLRRERFDIVHTHCSKAGVLGRIAARTVGGIAAVHSPHCFAFQRCGGLLQRKTYLLIERTLMGCTGVLAAVGPAEAAAAVRHRIVPPARCVPVCNGLEVDADVPCETAGAPADVRPAPGLPGGTRVIASVCRLVEYKGILRLLKAAELVKTSGCLFLVAGDGEMKQTAEAYVRDRGLSARVRFTGHLADVGPVYRAAQILVLCSDAEAMPYCLLEAMQVGCTVLATAVPGNRQLIEHNRTGVLVVPEPAAIAGAIDELLLDPDKRRRLARQAHEQVCTQYTLSRQIDQLARIYESLL